MSDGFQAQSTTDTCFCGRHNHAPWSGAWYGDEWHSLMVCGLGAEVERLTAALAERDRRIEKVRALIDERSHEAIVGMQRIIVVPAHVMRAALRGESDE